MTRTLLLTIVLLISSSGPAHASFQGLERALASYVKENYPWTEIEISDVSRSGSLPQEPPVGIRIEKGPLPGKAVFALEFRDGVRHTVSANVKAYDRIIASRRPFSKGYVMQQDDVYETLMDITRIPKSTLKDVDQVVGKPLMQSILANMPIQSSMVSDSLRLKTGRKVALVLETRGIRIRTTGELKQSGYVGEYVKVINPSSKKIITGLLVDENTVKVEF